jgi:mannose-6-phosphate isomerase-like protein (cupin superfamily)
LLGDETVDLNPQDIIYVPGDVVHQFRSIGSEPLGFLCIVPPH